MLSEQLKRYKVLLGSQSPRRKYLLEMLDISFDIDVIDYEEHFPEGMGHEETALFLAEGKAFALPEKSFSNNTLLITADTIVCFQREILGKPGSRSEAFDMLSMLSGEKHQVITGVCIRTLAKHHSFTASTAVWFKDLTKNEINYYIDQYRPYDKAGSYGIQEWIGYIGVQRIEGSYFNVMGLPVQHLYEELLKF